MKFLISSSFVYSLLFLGILFSCREFEEEVQPTHDENKDHLVGVHADHLMGVDAPPTPIQLGPQLANPYTVLNMQKAYDTLLALADSVPPYIPNIRTTHYYIKFEPTDSAEAEILEESSMEMFDYPLDREILTEGDAYQDPSAPLGLTYKYTVVKHGFEVPVNLPYTIIAALYLPETDLDTTAIFNEEYSPINEVLETLEDEALRITGNLETNDDVIEPLFWGRRWRRRNPRWRPQGFIVVENPINGYHNWNGIRYDGTAKVRVRVRRWFTIKTTETDFKGWFSIGHQFRRPVHYGVKYTNQHAYVKPSTIGFGPAFLDGPKRKGDWIYRSHQGSKSYLWGAIMNGVYDYHYKWAPQLNIAPPPDGIKIKSCGNNNCGVATMLHQQTFTGLFGRWLFSDIRIGHTDKPYDRIYATTIHELGHAAHWEVMGDWLIPQDVNMAFSAQLVREGWATGLTDVVYPMKFAGRVYPRYIGSCANNGILVFDEMKNVGYPRILVRDLRDQINEFNPNDPRCDVLNDGVRGISMHDIFFSLQGTQGTLGGQNSMTKWRNNIRDRNPGQAADIETYFEPWTR